MQTRIFLVLWPFLFFSPSQSYTAAPGKNPAVPHEILKSQQVLMEFVLDYNPSASAGIITALCQEALRKIQGIYYQLNNREQTLSFYSSLLDSSQYRELYPYVFCYLADFHGKELKEKYLLKSLKFSLNDQDRQFALTQLYRFYKQERLDYLELSYLLKLIEIQKLNEDLVGLETSYQDLGEIYENKRDYLTALDYYFEALGYAQAVGNGIPKRIPGPTGDDLILKNSSGPAVGVGDRTPKIPPTQVVGDHTPRSPLGPSSGSLNGSPPFWNLKVGFFCQLIQAFRNQPGENRSGHIYLKISNLFRILNRRELAKKYLGQALDYAVKHKNDDLKALVFHAYSQWYYEKDDYANALKFINLSLNTQKPRQKYLGLIPSLYQKARILLSLEEQDEEPGKGKISQAMELLKSAVDLGLIQKKYDGLLPIMSEYIERLITAGRFSQARAYLDQIDDIYAPYYPAYFFYYYLNALFSQEQGQMDTALHFYQKTTEKLEQFFSSLQDQQYHTFKPKTEEIYSRVIEFYLDLYNRTGNQLYIKKVLYFSEIKNSYIYEFVFLKNNTPTHFIEEKEKLEQEFLRCNKKYLQWLKNRSQGNPEGLRRYETQLESLKKQNEELREFILESPISYKKYSFKAFNLPLIQQRLNPGQLIIKYAVLKENIYAFGIDHHSTGYWRLTGTTQEILTKVKQLTAPLDDFTQGNVDYLRINYDLQLAHQLYELLFNGAWQFKPDIDEVFIIPDSELFKLPFEALVVEFNQPELEPDMVFSEYAAANYLIEKLPVSYAFSLFHFREKREKPGKNLPVKPGKYSYAITGFGSPIIPRMFSYADHPGIHRDWKVNRYGIEESMNSRLFHSLPSSQREIQDIPSIWGKEKTRVFLGKDFNRETFEKYAPQSGIVHIATHFINNVQYPQYSALLFSPIKEGSPFYYAHEIFKLKLDNELVILSACESSEKHLLGMQGLRGMTASFKQAGARSMMVSMWPVDEHSSKLPTWFYREYQTNPRPPSSISAALRAAKLNLLKQTATLKDGLKISFSHPFIWANYIVYHFK